jgi:broad specificity phosphatase PhoE
MAVKITYFVHGTTTDNEKELSTGQNPGELSDLGIRQSKELGEIIKDKKFDAIFSSDLKRAVDSANLTFKKDSIRDKRLRECNYGDLNGAPEDKVDYLKHIDVPFPNGESNKDVENRMREFLNDIKEKYDGKHIAILAHKSSQLALEVIVNGKSWEDAILEDWRKRKAWQPGWIYIINH